MEVLIIADEDNSGTIDIQEFMPAIVNVNAQITEQQIKETFDKYDDDNSGTLDVDEI